MSDDNIVDLFGGDKEATSEVDYSYSVDITRMKDGTLHMFVHRQDEPTPESMEGCAKDLVDAAQSMLQLALDDTPILAAIILQSGSFITYLDNMVQSHDQFDWLRERVSQVAQSLWNKEMPNGFDERVKSAIKSVANDKGDDEGSSA